MEANEFTYYIPYRPDQDTSEIDTSRLIDAFASGGEMRSMQKVSSFLSKTFRMLFSYVA